MWRKRRTEITIETHQVLVLHRRHNFNRTICLQCASGSAPLFTPEDAGAFAGVSTRTVYRWVEAGRVHFTETNDGRLFVCLATLRANGEAAT